MAFLDAYEPASKAFNAVATATTMTAARPSNCENECTYVEGSRFEAQANG